MQVIAAGGRQQDSLFERLDRTDAAPRFATNGRSATLRMEINTPQLLTEISEPVKYHENSRLSFEANSLSRRPGYQLSAILSEIPTVPSP
jgi:hypothetical protein